MSKVRHWSRGLAVLAAGVALIAYVLPAQLRPSNFPADDSYFYLQIARNIAAGHGSTFNGITPTNGYHPLWMVLCVAAAGVAAGDKFLLMRFAFAIQAILFVGIVAMYVKLAKSAAIQSGIVGIPILAGYFLTGLYGSEAHLNAMTTLLSLVALQWAVQRGRTMPFALVGIAVGLAVLARLDNIFLAAVVILASGASSERGRRYSVTRVLVVGVGAAITLAPYLLLNAVSFHHLMPISGATKSTFPRISGHVGSLGGLGTLSALAACAGLLMVATIGRATRWRRLILMLSSGVLLQAAYIIFFTEFGARWSWYYVAGVLNLCFVLGALADLAPARVWLVSRKAIVVSVTVILTASGVVRAWQRFEDPDRPGGLTLQVNGAGARHRWPDDIGVWLKGHLPAGSKVMVYDWPGAIAYYSDLSIVPVDGLVADYKYNDDLLRLGISTYVHEKGIRYYLGPLGGSPMEVQSVPVMAPLYRKSAGALVLRPDRLIASGHAFSTHPGLPGIGLWALSD